jgi:hypothetical protein
MKNKILSTVLISTLTLFSTNSFAEITTCKNPDMKDAIKKVDKSILRKTIQLRFNENDIKDMEELTADAQLVHVTSVALLSASIGAFYGLYTAATITTLSAGNAALMMTSLGLPSGFFSLFLTVPYEMPKDIIVGTALKTAKDAQDSLASKEENLHESSLQYGLEIKQATENFLVNFIEGSDKQLDEKTETLLAKHRDAGNGLLGGKGAKYAEALLGVVEARKKLYTLQEQTLQKLKINLERSCIALDSGKL